MPTYRRSKNPWNANYATPSGIREEDWQRAPMPGGLVGGWPLRSPAERATMVNNYMTATGAADASDGTDGTDGFGATTDTSFITNPLGLPKEIAKPVQLAGVAAMAYHGYKRNKSILWAMVWAAGGMSPLSWGIALAQGFGKKK